jgi:hypothetical protein
MREEAAEQHVNRVIGTAAIGAAIVGAGLLLLTFVL